MLSPTETEVENFTPGNTRFYVYLHKTPDDRVFYVGKGIGRRAFDLAPSRRSLYHRNIISKYGRENIKVQLIPCAYEAEAWMLERILIKSYRIQNKLANFTDGGEGSAGHKLTPRQIEALAKGRVKGKKGHPKSPFEVELIRKRAKEEKNIKRVRELGFSNRGKKYQRAILIKCGHCGKESQMASPRASFCSDACGQRNRRANGYKG